MGERVICAVCGTWTCLDCGHTRQHANRFSREPQKCAKCDSEQGVMEPGGHWDDERIANHRDKARDLREHRILPRYPLTGYDYGDPASFDRRWLVEVHPHFRDEVGQFEDIGASHVEIQDGCLVFRDARREILLLRASGTWLTCVPGDD